MGLMHFGCKKGQRATGDNGCGNNDAPAAESAKKPAPLNHAEPMALFSSVDDRRGAGGAAHLARIGPSTAPSTAPCGGAVEMRAQAIAIRWRYGEASAHGAPFLQAQGLRYTRAGARPTCRACDPRGPT